jgi:hypothetical protein
MTNQYKIGNLLIVAPGEWKDITDEVDEPAAPFTLAKDLGVGALQFSMAGYQSGKLPRLTLSALKALRHEFANRKGFSRPFDVVSIDGSIMASGGSYHVNEDLVRVWYCSNGRDVLLVTYVSTWSKRNGEATECDAILSKLKFGKSI